MFCLFYIKHNTRLTDLAGRIEIGLGLVLEGVDKIKTLV